MASSKLTLKLFIDKKTQRVLFAEASKDFIDFLFSLLALPVATVIRLLDSRDVVGGLAKVYQSLSDLNTDYIQSYQNKDTLLKPKYSLPFSHQLSLLPAETFLPPNASYYASTLYKCGSCDGYLATNYYHSCPKCKKMMSTVDGRYFLKSEADAIKRGGFVKELVTYMVMDDLSVSPLSSISNITLLSKSNVKDLGSLEEKVVDVGMNEGLQLLKHSLYSKTVLTDVFLSGVVVKDDNLEKAIL